MTQTSLNGLGAGINIVRVNFDRADPPKEVIDAFKAVQSAEQERDRLQKEADAYANKVLGQARGDAAQTIEQSEGYRAQVVNAAEGDASRFSAVLDEYLKAPEVTRRRLYIETMQEVLGGMNKVIIDQGPSGESVVPYLPLSELIRGATPTTGASK
jgi:membrane protease subunit HflK